MDLSRIYLDARVFKDSFFYYSNISPSVMVVSSGGAFVGGGNMFSNFLMWASPYLSSMNVFIPSIHCPSLAETPGPGAENKLKLD